MRFYSLAGTGVKKSIEMGHNLPLL